MSKSPPLADRIAGRSSRGLLLGLLALACAMPACETIGAQDRTRVNLYLQNAAQYYDEGHYERAYHQWEKVLAIEPMDDKARLGQGMALYQLGHAESSEGVGRLTMAEERLEEMRRENMDGQAWKAELGYALVQDRWVELYDRKVLLLEDQKARRGSTDEQELATAHRERSRRVARAEKSYSRVMSGGEREAQYQLTCLMGLAKMAMVRGDLDTTLRHAREYEEHVVSSKSLWRDAAEKFPKDAPIYESKLRGAERQEAQLRDLLGNVLFKLGRMEDALRELDRVIELDKDRSTAYLNRGMVRQQLRDWDRARQDFRTFLAMTQFGPDDPVVMKATEHLEAVKVELDLEDRALARPR